MLFTPSNALLISSYRLTEIPLGKMFILWGLKQGFGLALHLHTSRKNTCLRVIGQSKSKCLDVSFKLFAQELFVNQMFLCIYGEIFL